MASANTAPAPRAPAATDDPTLVHALQVHAIELEMQNEELRASRAAVEAGAGALHRALRLRSGRLLHPRIGTIRTAKLLGICPV
jgi:hypothetical protein